MSRCRFDPFYLNGPEGALFCLGFFPEQPDGRLLLQIPGWGEENNRSRHVMSAVGRTLADRGVASLIVDPSGTGDSEGANDAADWDRWRRDLAAAIGWARQEGYDRLALLGVRLMAKLALDAASECDPKPAAVLAWNPPSQGRRALDRILRIRVAQSIGRDPAERESVEQLRARLARGETLEVAGYSLSPALAAGIDSFVLTPATGVELILLDPPGPPRIAVTGAQARTVDAPRFWERAVPEAADALVAATVEETLRCLD